jgi:hypothetical protein
MQSFPGEAGDYCNVVSLLYRSLQAGWLAGASTQQAFGSRVLLTTRSSPCVACWRCCAWLLPLLCIDW